MLTLSWSVLLQTALLINHSRVLTFPDINNTAAPWPEWKRGNGQGFTLFFSLGYLQNSFSSWVWQNVKTVFLFICAEKFFTLPRTHARCHSTLPHGWGDLTLGSDTGHALARGILAGLTDRGCKGVWASELAPLHLCFHREKGKLRLAHRSQEEAKGHVEHSPVTSVTTDSSRWPDSPGVSDRWVQPRSGEPLSWPPVDSQSGSINSGICAWVFMAVC